MCRILAIAPYESMRNLIVNLCADRPEIQLTALVGDLEEGAKLVQTIPSEDYDIIISRGGTAEIIRTVMCSVRSAWWKIIRASLPLLRIPASARWRG